MKHDAISRRELPRLIRHIRQAGRFSATRGGHLIEIAVNPTLLRTPITYGACIGRQWHCGQAETVAAAVDRLNQLVRRTF